MKKTWATLLATGLLLTSSCSGGAVPQEFEIGMQALLDGNFAEAYCRWKPLAARGYAEAQYNFGWLYANGNGVPVDSENAVHWWREAAEQGHADAQFAVGLAYTTGEGASKDMQQAINWYLKAAKQGHQDARDILVRLSDDMAIDLPGEHPDLLQQSWFGWDGRVNSDRINVRTGPGTEYKILSKLEKDTKVRVVATSGSWYQVILHEDGDRKLAWIYKTLLTIDKPH